VPGPSAPIAALTVSGLPTDSFLYLGYLPHKTSERHKRLEEVESQPYTLVFLESPYRIVEALEDILSILGDRRVGIAREMTKMFEEYWRGTVSDAVRYFESRPARGEFTLVVEGRKEDGTCGRGAIAESDWELMKSENAKEISGTAKQSGWSKKAYTLINQNK
jgi:16S rRNA (cytidine1402-2'-O)-methyltransferase